MTFYLWSRWAPHLFNLQPTAPEFKANTTRENSQTSASSNLDLQSCRASEVTATFRNITNLVITFLPSPLVHQHPKLLQEILSRPQKVRLFKQVQLPLQRYEYLQQTAPGLQQFNFFKYVETNHHQNGCRYRRKHHQNLVNFLTALTIITPYQHMLDLLTTDPNFTQHNKLTGLTSSSVLNSILNIGHECWLFPLYNLTPIAFQSEFTLAVFEVFLVNFTIFVLTLNTLVHAFTSALPSLLGMGNEGSAPSSQDSTPISDYPSLYSIHSRVRSSVESTRAPSPMEAPEPDLSHLTAEEVAQIRSVMERAKHMQHEDTSRVRKVDEDFIDYSTKVEREASLAELVETGALTCPVCKKAEVTLNQDGSRSSMNVCVDCEKMTCTRCGSYHTSQTTRIQEWVCVVCLKRRRGMLGSGSWYQSYHQDSETAIERQVTEGTQLDRTRLDNSHMTSIMDTSMTSSTSQASSKDSRGSRESRGDSEHTGRISWEGSRCGGDSGLSMELSSLSAASSQNSELARQVYEQSKVKGILMYMMGPCGPGASIPKSESDEFSDRTSDLDFDELASERSRPDGGSSTDESNRDGFSLGFSQKEAKRQKHRPKSLNLSRSHSHTSSDEEDGGGSGGSDKKADSWGTDKHEPASKSKHSSSAASMGTDSSTQPPADPHKQKKQQPNSDHASKINSRDLVSFQELIDSHAVNSPTPPRSPSWREGLESPPFSPRRRDSYPGKRRGSLSPKEKNNHFTYADISPPSRQLSLDDLYGDMTQSSLLDNGVAGSHAAQKPSPLSPDEMRDSFLSTAGESLVFDMPPPRARPPVSISCSQPQYSDIYSLGGLPHSAPVMDLATYAATIANSTASLTSLSVSPTNLLPQPSHHTVGEPLSPDSTDSVDSSSPVSPGYYDNAPPPAEEVEEVELTDPSAKSIDYQGSKRQKVRPPSTDWSPVIDLSPILDVSPSVEEAEQEDMLAKQMEELERQRSREEIAYDEYDEEDECGRVGAFLEDKPLVPTKRGLMPVIPRIPPPPSAKKLKQQLNEEHDDDEDDNYDLEAPDDGSSYTYSRGLKRCGNFEDISQLGSDNSSIKHTSELLTNDRIDDDIDSNDPANDLPFFSCTTQSQPTPYSGTTTSTTISTLHAPGRYLEDKTLTEDHGSKRLRDLESLITDEIHKIAEDMENIAKRGAMDVKPIPPPKPKRRLPDPEILIAPPPGKVITEGQERRHYPIIRTEDASEASSSKESSFEDSSSGKHLIRQDSTEKKKAKDLKAKPSPILVQHIESEEQSVSPHYKVMQSPPTPEIKTIKREFSDSTSVSPNSSPDQDVYAFPSPVTPPDSDSSPPKPHSPSWPEPEQGGDTFVAPSGGSNLYRAASPYDNNRPTQKPRKNSPGLDSLSTVGFTLKQDQQNTIGGNLFSKPDTMMKPPISPRRSIRKFDDKKVNGRSSPLYENVKGLTTQEYLNEQHTALFDNSTLFVNSVPTLGKTNQFIHQQTDIVAYPLVGEFPQRQRSSSAPSTELQAEPQPRPRPEPPARPRSASAHGENGNQLERQTSVKDKIRAFEEISSKPKEKPLEKPEPKKETRREGNVMKDKRTDSGSSTGSSGSSSGSSSIKTSSSRSSSDTTHSQSKESPKNGKKVRRKLPPIPVGEDPVLVPKSKLKRTKPPTMKRGNGVDQGDDVPSGAETRRVQYQSTTSSESEGYFIGPSNRKSRSLTRDSDESMNEDDIEVAKLTTMRERSLSPKKKTHLAEVGKSKSLDSGETRARIEAAEAERVKPPIQRTVSLGYGPKDETDEIIDSLISIYGIPCTEAMKSLKKRLQEELRRVTKDRKRKLEELEEIRALQMQIGALKLESDLYARSRTYAGKRSPAQQMMVDSQYDNRKRAGGPSPSSSLTPRSSPQVTPRRQRHKRQSSDPMIAKFSPIKEDKDIEGDFQTRVHEPAEHRTIKYHTDDSSQSGISDCESTRSEPAREIRYSKAEPPDHTRVFYTPKSSHGGSSEKIHYSGYDQSRYSRVQPLSGSRSEQQLSSRSRSSVFYLDDEETKAREDKKAMLQYEIMKRKQQLEETARLKNELLKLARARQSLAHSYDDIPRQYVAPPSPHRSLSRGIIKPIDDESHYLMDHRSRPERGRRSQDHSRERSRERSMERGAENERHLNSLRDDALDSIVIAEHRYRDQHRRHRSPHQQSSQDAKVISNYSSSEYLAHKQESASRRYMDEPAQYGSQGWIASDYHSEGLTSAQAYSQPSLNKRVDSSQSLAVVRRASAKDVAGIVSSVTLPNIYADRGERDFRASYREPTFASTSISDTDGSPASDITPAMPLLDDVKTKSRTIIRNIGSGSRPVSAEFCAGDVEDLLNAMYRVESDNSVDADEPIMKHMTEGGVTILKQIDRKKRPAPVEPHRYSYPVKRILVTRDAKDKSITGNGLGMKIVGGKAIPGTNQVGAFVTAIYPILVDQLHGELDVGDQVLEWNGIYLTGLSADEVHNIISQTNGEIEMVVRAQMVPLTLTELSAQPESCRSSYDNLTLPSYEEESVKELPIQKQRAGHAHQVNQQGVDPRQLAAQLDGIREAVSPAENSPSSSHQDVATPSVSSPCSTPMSDPNSTSSDRQQHPATIQTAGDKTDKITDKSDRHQGKQRRRQSPSQEKTHHQQHHHAQKQQQPVTSPQHRLHHTINQPHQNQPVAQAAQPYQHQPVIQPHHQQDPVVHHHNHQPVTQQHVQHQPVVQPHHHHQQAAHHHHHEPVAQHHHHEPATQQQAQHQPVTQPRHRQQPVAQTSHQQQPAMQPSHQPSNHQHQPITQHHHPASHQHYHSQPTTQPHQPSTEPHNSVVTYTQQQHKTSTQSHQPPAQSQPPPTQPHQPSTQPHQPSTQPQQQLQTFPKTHQPNQPPQQQSTQSHQLDKEEPPPEHVPLPRWKTERRKQQELPVISAPDKPTATVDLLENEMCSSPALNDRLRASPPLDTRHSIRTRVSRKSKDNVIIPLKSPQETEKGEDFGLGEIQLQISHDDFDNTLNIHVIQARNLRPRDLNGLSDPFVKLYLLPGRGQENKRRTKHIARTLNPEWHQTVMFQDVARLELQNKVLEITVWDYDRFKTNDFLGELIIELREFAFLDNKPHWYPLKEHVTIQSFELPKSTVSPPKASDNSRGQTKSPRHGKKHGVSSLNIESAAKEGADNRRRQSLGSLTGNGTSEASTTRQISSATNSPIPARRPRGTKSPIKTKSNGLLYR